MKNIDQRVLSLLQAVKQKKAEITLIEKKPNWKTNLSFSFSEDIKITDRINLHVISSLEKLIEIYSFLDTKESQWKKSIADMNLSNEISLKDPMWLSFSISDWKKDVISRSEMILLNNKKKELEALESKIDKLITPEQRREIELEKLEKDLLNEV